MKNTKKIIWAFFEPHFQQHPEMESFWFHIYGINNKNFLCDSDFGINDQHQDEILNYEMSDACLEIHKAITILEQSKNSYAKTAKRSLTKIVSKLRAEEELANERIPLVKIMSTIWTTNNIEQLEKKLSHHLKTEFPWKNIQARSGVYCQVTRDGTVDFKLHGE
jgi:hypothetical protein